MALEKIALLLAALVMVTLSSELPPSCDSRVYCSSELLHQVMMLDIYPDSKTYVDKRLLQSEDVILDAYDVLSKKSDGKPSKEEVIDFLSKYVAEGDELEDWIPTDLNPEPAFLSHVKDESLRQFGRDINAIWPLLGRKVSEKVYNNPELFSLIPLPNGFMIPGGRFKEIYYWDSYWIIEGLLVCGMKDTARGMIENLLELVRKLGHVPNGSRKYYQERSQPPLLTAMVGLYFKETRDREFLSKNIDLLESEIDYWLKSQTVDVDHNTLLRYNTLSSGPRPESYREDYTLAQKYFDNDERRQDFYHDLKCAAESGWDFSSRWFIDNKGGNSGDLSNIRTRRIVPVELNAIFASALKTLGDFRMELARKNPRNRFVAAKWWKLAARWRFAIDRVLWNNEDGVWYDYDIDNKRHRKYFYPTNLAPLWMESLEPFLIRQRGGQVVKYLTESEAVRFPGGVPSSLMHTGEQWDFPNAWPPLESIVIGALDKAGTPKAKELALELANKWVRANYAAFNLTGHMYEKYDVRESGGIGGGGEYEVQIGFGWSNGVILELLGKFGDKLTLTDDPADESAEDSKASLEHSKSAEDSSDRARA